MRKKIAAALMAAVLAFLYTANVSRPGGLHGL